MVNKTSPGLILGEKRLLKNQPAAYALGSEEEAVIYATYGKKAWLNTPGAVAWLHATIRK